MSTRHEGSSATSHFSTPAPDVGEQVGGKSNFPRWVTFLKSAPSDRAVWAKVSMCVPTSTLGPNRVSRNRSFTLNSRLLSNPTDFVTSEVLEPKPHFPHFWARMLRLPESRESQDSGDLSEKCPSGHFPSLLGESPGLPEK